MSARCEDCHSAAALPGCRKCYECRDFQLRINARPRYQHDHQCVLCGEVMKYQLRKLCAQCISRGAVIEFDVIKVNTQEEPCMKT